MKPLNANAKDFHLRTLGRNRRKRLAQAITEVMAAACILIPFVLAAVDLGMLYLGGEVATDVAKQAARAAANSASQAEATTAVADVASKFKSPASFKNLQVKLTKFDNTAGGVVTVSCTVQVVLPISVPMLGVGPIFPIQSRHSEPIVGIPASSS